MKIALFGGSFDPIHNAHIEIIKYSLNNLGIDKLVLMPSKISPFKVDTGHYASNEHRILMLNEVLSNELKEYKNKIEISEFEMKCLGVSYTYNTLLHFETQGVTKQNLLLLIGEDNYITFEKWYKADEILTKAQVVVFSRGENSNLEKMTNKKIEFSFVYDIKSNLSSTDTRDSLKSCVFDESKIPLSVIEFIKKHKVYK